MPAAAGSIVGALWVLDLENTLSIATIAPTAQHVEAARALLACVPGGLSPAWLAVVAAARAWLEQCDRRAVPAFPAVAALSAAVAETATGWRAAPPRGFRTKTKPAGAASPAAASHAWQRRADIGERAEDA